VLTSKIESPTVRAPQKFNLSLKRLTTVKARLAQVRLHACDGPRKDGKQEVKNTTCQIYNATSTRKGNRKEMYVSRILAWKKLNVPNSSPR